MRRCAEMLSVVPGSGGVDAHVGGQQAGEHATALAGFNVEQQAAVHLVLVHVGQGRHQVAGREQFAGEGEDAWVTEGQKRGKIVDGGRQDRWFSMAKAEAVRCLPGPAMRSTRREKHRAGKTKQTLVSVDSGKGERQQRKIKSNTPP